MVPAAVRADDPAAPIATPDAAAVPRDPPDSATGRRSAAEPKRNLDERRRRQAAPRRAARLAEPPSEDDVARLLAEFRARGGRVTECPPAHAAPVNNGAGRDASRWTV
jgi:hypothetical protein